jgi:transglutaminase-like putative cysteine protease
MRLTTTLLLETNAASSVACILMLYPQSGTGQTIRQNEVKTSASWPSKEYMDVFGNRCLRTEIPAGAFRLEQNIVADCVDVIDVDPLAAFVPMQEVPDEVLQFLLPSRYCQSDLLGGKAKEITAAAKTGYQQVEAIRQWIYDHFEYAYGTTDASTSASDVLISLKGVCRDYTHAGLALCRSLDIPARMVVGYLYQLDPMDLHAWFEAFVGGRWFTFDATQTSPKGNRIIVAYGRDAADVAIATYFSDIKLTRLEVTVSA